LTLRPLTAADVAETETNRQMGHGLLYTSYRSPWMGILQRRQGQEVMDTKHRDTVTDTNVPEIT